MSGRKNVLNYELAANQSLSSSFITPATIIQYLDNCSYQINVSTTSSQGTFSVQVSNDYEFSEISNQPINTGTWTSLTLSGTPAVAGANDTIDISMNQLPYYAMRLVYNSTTAGTGTCSVFVNCKQSGG